MKRFKRHQFLAYQGYAFPWYATLLLALGPPWGRAVVREERNAIDP